MYWSVAASYFRMRNREEDADEDAVAIMSPSPYFASGCAVAGNSRVFEEDSSEQPAIITQKIRRREKKRPNREFPVIDLS